MPLGIIRQDITKITADAIVNAANSTLLGGGGVDGAIHKAAGPRLLEECEKLGGCPVGMAKLTRGYDLPSKYVIHTVGPVWRGGSFGEEALLRSCYRESLAIAKKKKMKKVAFPLISAGAYGYPKKDALRIATEEIGAFLMENDMKVVIAVFDKASFAISERLYSDIREYIDDVYAAERGEAERQRAARYMAHIEECSALPDEDKCVDMTGGGSMPAAFSMKGTSAKGAGRGSKRTLQQMLGELDESFSEMLLRKIDEKGMTDAQCYKKANIDRKLFSKIRSDKNYRPKKATAIAFAIALELSLAETSEMLKKAGYALSHSNEFDIIIEYFIRNGIYDIYEINEALFAFDQVLLGV